MRRLETEIAFSADSFYAKVKRLVRKEKLFQTWFSHTVTKIDDEGRLFLQIHSPFALDFIRKKFGEQLKSMVLEEWGLTLKLTLGEATAAPPLEEPAAPASRQVQVPAPVRKRSTRGYRFEDFVCDHDNRLALVACQSITQGGEPVHSPLTLVGDHGLGKTHLISSIADNWPEHEVLCWHAEEFVNAYVRAVRQGEIDTFRALIRSKRLVVIEDLDYLLEGNREKSVTELTASLKVLKREKRQVVLSTRAPLYHYEKCAPRLAQVILSGLNVKLVSPKPKVMGDLVEHFARQTECNLSPKGMTFLKEVPFRSPRELKAAIKKIAAYTLLNKERLPISVLRELLSDHLRMVGEGTMKNEGHDLHQIGQIVAEAFGLSLTKLLSSKRNQHVSLARHTAMAISYRMHYTLKEIGRFYGGRTHQTVLYALKRVEELNKNDMDYRTTFRKLLDELNASSRD